MSGQLQAPASLPRRKSPRYPLDSLGMPQNWSGWWKEKNIDPTGTRNLTFSVQPIASRYINCTTPSVKYLIRRTDPCVPQNEEPSNDPGIDLSIDIYNIAELSWRKSR
jgi:hypothetical protein